MNRSYRLLVFDWDGTLMDSVQRIVQCFQASFRQAGLPVPEAEPIKQTIGLPLADGVRCLLAPEDYDKTPALVEIYRDIWLGGTLPLAPLFDGAQAMLETFRDQGYDLAVATGKSRVGLERDMDRNKVSHLFKATRCALETQAKPHPEMLHEIMDTLSSKPGETLMIGDTTMDLEMANNAGVDGVGVTTGGHPEAQLLSAKPVACLDHVTHLTGHLAEG